MMYDVSKCPECGAELGEDAPQGLCPKCLMARAMEDSGEEHPQTALPRAASQKFGGATQQSSPADTPTIPSDPHQTVPSQVDLGSVDSDVAAALEPPGKYSVLGQYGKGGMGRVLLVHDEHLGRDVALKELLPDLSEGDTPTPAKHSKEMASRFLREAKITGQLEHPSITPVHELGRRPDGTLYYTMKLVKGRTLQAAIREAANMEERLKLLPHFVDLCNAIAYAHSRGVIHRDIKPANVMVGDYGETVILDWGLAKVKGAARVEGEVDPAAETLVGIKADTGSGSDAAKTQYGQALGTPVYMSPEQAAGDLDHVDERSDVYSLGAVLFEIITGVSPFDGISVEHILRQVIAGDVRSVKEFASKAPKELIRIVENAMAREPRSRYSNAKLLANAVEGWRPIRVPRWIKRSVAAAAVGIVGMLVAAVVDKAIMDQRLQLVSELLRDSRLWQLVSEKSQMDNLETLLAADENWLAEMQSLQNRYPSAFGTNPNDSFAPLMYHLRYDHLNIEVYTFGRFVPRYVSNMNEDRLAKVQDFIDRQRVLLEAYARLADLPDITEDQMYDQLVSPLSPEKLVRLNYNPVRDLTILAGVDAICAARAGSPGAAIEHIASMGKIVSRLHQLPYMKALDVACFVQEMQSELAQELVRLGYSNVAEMAELLARTDEDKLQEQIQLAGTLEQEAFLTFFMTGLQRPKNEKNSAILFLLQRVQRSFSGVEEGFGVTAASFVLMSRPFHSILSRDAMYYLEESNDWLSKLSQPYAEWNSLDEENYGKYKAQGFKNFVSSNFVHPFSGIALNQARYPYHSRRLAETTTYSRLNSLGIAASTYVNQTGSAPPSLEILAEGLGDNATTDPFTGEPFRLSIADGELRIYSVGSNGQDDGGAEHGRMTRDDLVWNIPLN